MQIFSLQSSVKEDAAGVCDESVVVTQTENFEARIKASLSKLDDKVEFIQERLLNLETTITDSIISKLSKD